MIKINLLAALVLLFTACTSGPPVKTEPPRKFHYGKAVGDRYENPFFGLRLIAPSGWNQQQLHQEKLDDPITADLFQVWQHPLESGAVDDANILLFAERKNHNPATNDTGGYLVEMKGALKMIGYTDDEMSAIETVSLGGKPFGKMTITRHSEESTLVTRQEYYVRLVREYWLVIVETTYHDDDKAIIDKALKNMAVD